MYLVENNGNLSETKKNVVYSQPFLKMRKFLLHMRKDFLIMSNFYLVDILCEPNSLTIVTSKKTLKMSNYVLILIIYFLKMRIRICSVLFRTFTKINNVMVVFKFGRIFNIKLNEPWYKRCGVIPHFPKTKKELPKILLRRGVR